MASEKDKGTTGIIQPYKNDVLSGRGNSVNFHPGNEYFRSLVKQYRVEYVACPKPLKGHFSKLIVDNILSLDPPGRFLKQDPKTKLWTEIGYKKSLDKTRQALREGAPELMKEMNLDTPNNNKAAKAASSVPDNIVSVTPEPKPMSPPMQVQIPAEVKSAQTLPGLLTKPDETKHITIKDMENILETLQKTNNGNAAAAPPYRDNVDTHSISSDIFSDGGDSSNGDSMDDEKANMVPPLFSTRTIVDQAPGSRPSITLGSSAPPPQKGVSWSVSMDKLTSDEGNTSLDDLLRTVRNQLSTSDFENHGNISLDQIITTEKLDTIPLEQRSELLIAISQFLQVSGICNEEGNTINTTAVASATPAEQEVEHEFDLSQYANRTTGPRQQSGNDPNVSEMSMSFSSLGTFDPYSLYPYKKDKDQNDEKRKNNRSRSRLDDYNNSLFDSMQMSMASLQMDNAD